MMSLSAIGSLLELATRLRLVSIIGLVRWKYFSHFTEYLAVSFGVCCREQQSFPVSQQGGWNGAKSTWIVMPNLNAGDPMRRRAGVRAIGCRRRACKRRTDENRPLLRLPHLQKIPDEFDTYGRDL